MKLDLAKNFRYLGLMILILVSVASVSGDTAPEEPSPMITPSPLYDSSDANCEAIYRDPDGDKGTLIINWSISGNNNVTQKWFNVPDGEHKTSVLNSDFYDDGQQVLCNATAIDNGDPQSNSSYTETLVKTEPPVVSSGPNFVNYSSYHSFNVSAVVEDKEGQDDVTNCWMNVSDGQGNWSTFDMVMKKDYGDEKHLKCFYSNVSNWTTGFDVLEEINTTVWVNDTDSEKDNESAFNPIPNSPPRVFNVKPEDDSTTSSPEVDLEVNVMDDDGEKVDLTFWNITGATPEKIGSGFENLSGGSYASVEWKDLSSLKTFYWRVEISDEHQNITRDFRFRNLISSKYRVQTDLDYRYSSVITGTDSSVVVPFLVENTAEDKKNLRSTISGVNAEFSSEGDASVNYELQPGEKKRFDVVVAPKKEGNHILQVKTVNKDFKVTTVDEMRVDATNLKASSEDVPGVGLIQLLLIFAFSTTFLYYSELL